LRGGQAITGAISERATTPRSNTFVRECLSFVKTDAVLPFCPRLPRPLRLGLHQVQHVGVLGPPIVEGPPKERAACGSSSLAKRAHLAALTCTSTVGRSLSPDFGYAASGSRAASRIRRRTDLSLNWLRGWSSHVAQGWQPRRWASGSKPSGRDSKAKRSRLLAPLVPVTGDRVSCLAEEKGSKGSKGG
jgi:hypothetical protein